MKNFKRSLYLLCLMNLTLYSLYLKQNTCEYIG